MRIPGLANVHSHAFQRALRGHTRGSFADWRRELLRVAGELTPDSYFALAKRVYAEMLQTGITTVGECHEVHHQPDGTPYDDPNEMGRALLAAADEVGIRIRLLDTCYLTSATGDPVEGVLRRFSDGSAEAWAERVAAFDDDRVGAAIHSVLTVPRDQLRVVAEWADARPLHVHLSERATEHDRCLAAHGLTPTQLLAEADVLGPTTTVVHATHVTADDARLLGAAHVFACLCPTTERDLGDGIGPSRLLHAAGCRVVLGSASHAVIDLFEEMRAVEMHERLATRQRGHWSAQELLEAATLHGHAALGFTPAGEVTLDTDSIRTHGCGASPEMVVFAATAADVTQVRP